MEIRPQNIKKDRNNYRKGRIRSPLTFQKFTKICNPPIISQ